MAKVIIMGSGSGFSVSSRFCTSIALLVDNDCYLFDCGEPAGSLLFRNGIDPLSLKSIFVSHLHPDHISGLASVLFAMYLPGRSKEKKFKPWSITRYDDWYREDLWFPEQVIEEDQRRSLDLYLPEEGIKAIESYLRAVYLAPEVLPFDISLVKVNLGEFFQDGKVTVKAVENDHLRASDRYQPLIEKYPFIKFQSYSFSFRVGGQQVVFSGDIDHLEELDPLMENANLAILEVAHYDPELIKPYIDRYSLDRVILTHIHPGLEERIKELQVYWGDPRIKIAKDGFEIDV